MKHGDLLKAAWVNGKLRIILEDQTYSFHMHALGINEKVPDRTFHPHRDCIEIEFHEGIISQVFRDGENGALIPVSSIDEILTELKIPINN